MRDRLFVPLLASSLVLTALAAPACRLADRGVDPVVTAATDATSLDKRSERSGRSRQLTGPSVAVGRGRAWAFVELGKRNRPVAFGIVLSQRALRGLPTSGPEVEYVLQLPRRARLAPFTHVGLNWNPTGHAPDPVYGVPHFDMHFYTITEAERHAIDGSRGGQDPGVAFIPPDYISTVDVVPHMGVHWADVTAPEFQPGGRFTRTMIYGFYDGVLAFLEPMVTLDFLRSGRSSNLPIKQAAQVQRTGWYPTRYTIRREDDRVVVRLSGLVHRDGTMKGLVAAED